MALLNTYSSERELEVTRERNIEPIRGRIKSSTERLAAVEKRLKEIQDEMEFYKAGKSRAARDGKDSGKSREAPHSLLAELDRIQAEKQALHASIASQEKEIEGVNSRFEADRKRWLALKNRN
jgi:chromosome segregation ATPase